MAGTIVLVHGRHLKPPRNELRKHWVEALRFGIQRDHPEKLEAFDKAAIEFVYFGDISNAFLKKVVGLPSPNDITDRKATLAALKQYRRNQFNKAQYKKLPGYNPWMESLADLFAGPAHFFGLSQPVIELVAPDVAHYWQSNRFGSDVRAVLTKSLIKVMRRPGDICLIAHSLGTMMSYDVLWKFSHYSEYRNEIWNRPVKLWITLGCPLGDETVKQNLKGADLSPLDRYPHNIQNWLNIAAQDDYVSHDQKISNDFRQMKQLGFVDSIRDRRIYNLAVRFGESNPHHSIGFLIHPAVANAVAGWL